MLKIDDIIAEVKPYKCLLVEVTGGEPLIQNETPDLIQRLLDDEYEVLLETNGTQDISRIDERCVRIVDIKCPSSGEEKKADLKNLNNLTDKDEVKFVIGDREDYEYAKRTMNLIPAYSTMKMMIHFSAVFGRIDPKTLAEWILEDHLNVRLHLQLHKVIWDQRQRGI
jgi:7-carboxy-7-deazaguanine synthase